MNTERLQRALIAADAAGDTEAAKLFAAQLKTAMQPQKAAPITGGDLARSALSGATFQFGDELRGAASAALGAMTGQGDFGELYDVTRDYERGKAKEFTGAHPVAAATAELAGGLGTGILGGVKAAGTTAGKALASQVAKQGLLGRAKTAAAVGAGTGAASGGLIGAGAADEIGDVPGEVVKGAAIGGVLGAATGPLAEVGMAAARGAKSMAKKMRDPQYNAARATEKAIERSGMTMDEALDRADALGGTLADTSIPAREALETVTNQPGAARETAMKALETRSRKQGGELLSDLGPGKKHETVKALAKFREQEASPLYEKAFERGVPHTKKLEGIFNDLEEFTPGMWQQAKKLGRLGLKNEGKDIPKDALGDARPSLRGWQYMKEQLDDKISALYRSGDNKAASALKSTQKRLLAELDELNPNYGEARAKWAGAAQFEDMLDKADRFMTVPAGDFEDMLQGISKIDLEAVRIGAIQAIEDRIQKGQWTHDVAKFFRTPAMDRKMRALFDNDKQFAAFKNKLNSATEKQKTFDAVRGNSATARRQAAQKDANDWISLAMDATMDTMTGAGTPSLLRRGAGILGDALDGLRPGSNEAARAATTELLLEPDPVIRRLNMLHGQGILNMPPPKPGSPLLPAHIGGLLGIGGTLAATP